MASYLSEDPIASLATGSSGGGALSIVRVSGPAGVFATLGKIIRGLDLIKAEPRVLHRAQISDLESQPLDEPLVVKFQAPHSFTGEDVVEFHLHGGAYLATRVMGVLAGLKIRQALPGEFSFRAVRNGKISITQAQAISDLIGSSNDSAITLALEKMSGSQNHLMAALAKSLRDTAVLAEAGIDFSDQNLDEVGLTRLKASIQLTLETLQKLIESFTRGVRIQNGITAAFLGLPNVGKSSFFNALLGEERSIVSEIPGTTRDVVGEQITLRGGKEHPTASVTLRVEDTAGLRQSKDPIEAQGMKRTLQSAQNADLILLVIDPDPLSELPLNEWKALGNPTHKTIGIITKSDLYEGALLRSAEKRLASIGIRDAVCISSINGSGITDATQKIVDFTSRWIGRQKGEVVLTREEHANSCRAALTHLTRSLGAPEHSLFAADLRQALGALSPLIGETLPDDILGEIFSNFCIGK